MRDVQTEEELERRATPHPGPASATPCLPTKFYSSFLPEWMDKLKTVRIDPLFI